MKKEQLFNAMSGIDGELSDRSLAHLAANATGKETKTRKTRVALIAAAVAVVLIVAGVSIFIALRRAPDPDTVRNGNVSVSVPDWYAPGELNMLTLIPKSEGQKTLMTSGGDGVSMLTAKKYARPSILKKGLVSGGKNVMELGDFGDALAEEDIPILPERRFTFGDSPAEYQLVGKIGSRYIRVGATDPADEHHFCDGLFYDIRTGTFICLNHHIAEMNGVEILENDIDGFPTHYVDIRGDFDGLCVVQIHTRKGDNTEEEKESGVWSTDVSHVLYDFEKDTVTTIPDEMDMSLLNGYFMAFNGGRIILFVAGTTGDPFEFILKNGLRLATLGDDGTYTFTDVPSESGYSALQNGSAYMTSDGRYLVYAAPVGIGENGAPVYRQIQTDTDACFRVFDTVSGDYHDVRGRFVTLTEDSRYLLYEDENGKRLAYDLALNVSGELVASASYSFGNTSARYEIRKKKSDRAGKYLLEIIDNITGQIAETVPYVDSAAESNGYLYYFTADDMTVTCREMIPDGRSFTVDLSRDFADAYHAHGEHDWNMSRVQVSDDGKQLIVYFETFADNYYIWVPYGQNPDDVIPDELRRLPPQYWHEPDLDTALRKMLQFSDSSVGWDITATIDGYSTPAPIPQNVAFDIGGVLAEGSGNVRNAERSVIDGKPGSFEVTFEITLEGGEKIAVKVGGYQVSGKYYLDFNGHAVYEIMKDYVGEDLFSRIADAYLMRIAA